METKISEEEKLVKNEVLNKNFPGLDLEVDDSGNISDVEFPDKWSTADTHELLCKLLTDFAERKWGIYVMFGLK